MKHFLNFLPIVLSSTNLTSFLSFLFLTLVISDEDTMCDKQSVIKITVPVNVKFLIRCEVLLWLDAMMRICIFV